MLRGDRVGLRARIETDVAVLHAELYEDVDGHSRSDSRPWVPIASGPTSPYAVSAPAEGSVSFSAVRLDDDELIGDAVLWKIDNHNRSAHLGIALRPGLRGLGLGTEVVNLLCRYGFVVRGLNRLQVDTLADNEAMIRAAERVGFRREALLQQGAWVSGAFIDEVLLGLLAVQWSPLVLLRPAQT